MPVRAAVVTLLESRDILKQAALLFDQIYLAEDIEQLDLLPNFPEELKADFRWLRRKGVFVFLTEPNLTWAYSREIVREEVARRGPLASSEAPINGSTLREYATAVSRCAAAELRDNRNINAVVLTSQGFTPASSDCLSDKDKRLGDVCEIVIKELPLPGPLTGWDDVLSFRSDATHQASLRKLRLWMDKVAASSSAVSELADELKDLLSDYERYMRIQGMKVNTGILETVVTVSAKVAEDLVKVKWGELGRLPFLIRHRRIDLLEAEMRAPGREIAYVASARAAFPVSPQTTLW